MKSKRGRPLGRKKGARKAVTEIVALRIQAKLSENQLAARVGLSQSTVNRLLSGDEPRWTPALRKLCDYAKNTLKPNLLRRLSNTHPKIDEIGKKFDALIVSQRHGFL